MSLDLSQHQQFLMLNQDRRPRETPQMFSGALCTIGLNAGIGEIEQSRFIHVRSPPSCPSLIIE